MIRPVPTNELAFRAGFGTGILTAFEPGACMFGWGDPVNVCEGVASDLLARALVLEERATGRRVVYVVCELGMISESVRRVVAERVCTAESGLADHDLMVTATHTHAGPGGFSTYLFYALSIPGVSRHVHDAIVEGIVTAIERALRALRPARAWVHAGWIPVSEPLAFNRSIEAYNRNADTTPVTLERRDEAVERTMTVLRVDDEHDVPMGLVSWFPVHGTSVHAENRLLGGDNKGWAARQCEAWAGERGAGGFVALFAQESTGDVTPNFRWSAARHKLVGRYDDDDESARFAGDIQARHTRALFTLARDEGHELTGPLATALRYVDIFEAAAPPRLGLTFSVGTLEGQGPFFALRDVMPWLSRLQGWSASREPQGSWRARHGRKVPFWDMGLGKENKVLGVLPPVGPLLRLFEDRFVDYYRRAVPRPGGQEITWVPRYLPIQQLRIGPLVVAGLPNEPTTVAGRRLRAAVAGAWRGQGVERIVMNGYANAYSSYLTTPEEYDLQAYEGASTLYGRDSLSVFIAELVALTEEIRAGRAHATLGSPPAPIPLEWCLEA